jgi:hypothetical protein
MWLVWSPHLSSHYDARQWDGTQVFAIRHSLFARGRVKVHAKASLEVPLLKVLGCSISTFLPRANSEEQIAQ